jgi:hypothetical protein
MSHFKPNEVAQITADRPNCAFDCCFGAAFARAIRKRTRARGVGGRKRTWIERNDMTQSALSAPNFDIFPSPGPTSAPAATMLAFRQAGERQTPLPDATSRDGSCLKGFGFALGIELGAALCFFGAWQLWQTFR